MGAAALPLAIIGQVGSLAAGQRAASAERRELAVAAEQEKFAAVDRELERRRRYEAILGAQQAQAAAAGIQFSGSVANVAISDAKRAAEESRIDDYNTRLRLQTLRRRSSSVQSAANARGATQILNFVETQL